MNRHIIATLIAMSVMANAAVSATFYVDGNLSSDITNGTYSIAGRGGGGSDGNAYKTIKNGIAALASGDTMNIRAGTYQESATNTGVGSPGNFAAMTYMQAYNGENVVWQNNSTQLGDIWKPDVANNVTVKGINFRGQLDVPINQYSWTVYSGNIWQTTGYHYELTEFKSTKRPGHARRHTRDAQHRLLHHGRPVVPAVPSIRHRQHGRLSLLRQQPQQPGGPRQ